MSDNLTGPRLAKSGVKTKLIPKLNEKSFPAETQLYQGKSPVTLLILDGWGIGPKTAGNAVELANTPTMDQLWTTYPHTQLEASGEYVGLPKGVDGNSETGHINIGAGSIVLQSLPRVDSAIEDGSFFQNQELVEAMERARQNGTALHLIGLVGPAFVHSNVEHLYALLRMAADYRLERVYIHAFTDGRDSSPNLGIKSLEKIVEKTKEFRVGKLASITGRFYGMDRDRNWERTQKAYDLIVSGKGQQTSDWQQAVKASYDSGTGDEYLEPIAVEDEAGETHPIEDGDVAIVFNFRVDRPRQISWALGMDDFEYRDLEGSTSGSMTAESERDEVKNFKREKIVKDLYLITMADFDTDFSVPKVFSQLDIPVNLGQVLTKNGVRQLRLTETEKEKMVTYYINGRQNNPNPGENWIIYPSKKTRSYADIPEMDAAEIADELVEQIIGKKFDAAVVNICNGDMVGHTGVLEAGIEACEVVDKQVKKIVEAVLKVGGTLMITADHGNIEEMIDNETGEVDTAHSIYPVPLIIVSEEGKDKPIVLPKGILADLAPTMIKLLGLEKPEEMTGRALV